MGESQVLLAKRPVTLTQICMQSLFRQELLRPREQMGPAKMQICTECCSSILQKGHFTVQSGLEAALRRLCSFEMTEGRVGMSVSLLYHVVRVGAHLLCSPQESVRLGDTH